MKRMICAVAAVVLAMILCSSCAAEKPVTELTYAVFPYLPDTGRYEELIEEQWAQLEPDIRLIRADYDCYSHSAPDGIDVIMYDSIMCDTLIENNWIQPIAETDIQDKEDILPFALEGFFRDGKLYGIPVFLCGNFLIYDENCENLASAEHLTDLAGERKILVAATEDPMNKPQYYLEAVADIQGTPHPSDQPNQDAEQMVALLNQLAIEEYKAADFDQVPVIYDGGTGKGYLGYSESMRLLKARSSHTGIKQISFSEKENMPRLYADAVAVTSGVQGQRFEKCLELMNLISSAQTLQDLSVVDGRPQYLMLARKSLYDTLSARFPLYSTLKELAFDERNSVITH